MRRRRRSTTESPTRRQRWRDLVGYYTRFGDVRELLAGVDDRYVIMNAGDELRLRVSGPPPPAAGWARDFVLVGDGWEKDGDYNTGFSQTVLPLPSHDRPDYGRRRLRARARGRSGVPAPSRRLGDVSHALRDADVREAALDARVLRRAEHAMAWLSRSRSAARGFAMRESVDLSLLCVALLVRVTSCCIDRRPARVNAGDSERHDATGAPTPLRLPARGVGRGARASTSSTGPDLRRAAGAHHAAGRVDGRRGRGRRLRSRRLAGLLRHQQRRGQPQPPLPQQRRRHVQRRRGRDGRRRRERSAAPACRWAPSGATTTTTATRICSSTSTAGRSCFTTSRARRFVAVGEQAGLPAWVNANSAIWLDYDRDGRLDLFLAGYWPEDVDLWKLETTKIMPESFEYARTAAGSTCCATAATARSRT